MIGGKRKTVGVFINKTDDYFDDTVFRVLQDQGKKMNIDLLFFFTVGYHGSSNHYDTRETDMFRFVPVEKLDGIVVVPGSYEMADFYDSLMELLHTRVTCPVIMIRSGSDEYDSVFTDGEISITPLLRHLIEDHKLTRIAFLAGYQGHSDSEMRQQCYLNELKNHGLTVPEHGIYNGTMWYRGSDSAYSYFFEGVDEIPQAVVCANDYMAYGLIGELNKHGYRVPEDVIVTGFDHIDSAPFPISLTTVGQDYETMTREALNQLVRRMESREKGEDYTPSPIRLTGALSLGESCGCCKPNVNSYKTSSVANSELLSQIRQRQISQTYLAIELNSCDSLVDMHDVLIQKSEDVPAQRDFYLCLFTDNPSSGSPVFAEDITDHVTLAIAFRDRQDLGMPMVTFNRTQFLPPMTIRDDEPQAFFIILLHQGNSTYGYSAMQFMPGETPTIFYHHWNVIISSALRNMHMQSDLRRLYEERRLSSITDPLTKLNNRRGLEEMVNPFWSRFCNENESICLVYMDLDNLKTINDTFGHSEGDRILRDFALLLRKLTPPGATLARMGGDEFLCFIPDVSHNAGRLLVNRINAAIEEYNRDSEQKLGCSFGIYSTRLHEGITFESCLIASDELMYKNKTARKAGR